MSTHPNNDRQMRHQAPSRRAAAPGLVRRVFARMFKRPEVTTFHRCLAVHMRFMAPRSALD